jgi:hypothetical protein
MKFTDSQRSNARLALIDFFENFGGFDLFGEGVGFLG